MISHRDGISIPRGGAKEKDEELGCFFIFLFFVHHKVVIEVQEIAGSTSYGENKIQNPKQISKRNIHCRSTS